MVNKIAKIKTRNGLSSLKGKKYLSLVQIMLLVDEGLVLNKKINDNIGTVVGIGHNSEMSGVMAECPQTPTEAFKLLREDILRYERILRNRFRTEYVNADPVVKAVLIACTFRKPSSTRIIGPQELTMTDIAKKAIIDQDYTPKDNRAERMQQLLINPVLGIDDYVLQFGAIISKHMNDKRKYGSKAKLVGEDLILILNSLVEWEESTMRTTEINKENLSALASDHRREIIQEWLVSGTWLWPGKQGHDDVAFDYLKQEMMHQISELLHLDELKHVIDIIDSFIVKHKAKALSTLKIGGGATLAVILMAYMPKYYQYMKAMRKKSVDEEVFNISRALEKDLNFNEAIVDADMALLKTFRERFGSTTAFVEVDLDRNLNGPDTLMAVKYPKALKPLEVERLNMILQKIVEKMDALDRISVLKDIGYHYNTKYIGEVTEIKQQSWVKKLLSLDIDYGMPKLWFSVMDLTQLLMISGSQKADKVNAINKLRSMLNAA